MTKWLAGLGIALLAAGCGRPDKFPAATLTVAAAGNLTDVFEETGKAFTAASGIRVVYSHGSTALLTQQIENSAPFDLFAAADTQHLDQLAASGRVVPQSRAIYARGQLAVWFPKADGNFTLEDLGGPRVRYIAIANPALAPYGAAAVEALKNLRLWTRTESKLVYASSVSMAKQQAATGNADAAITAYSLVLRETGSVAPLDPKLHRPIDQALGIVAASPRRREASQYAQFLLGPQGRAILARYGYALP